MNFKSNRRKLLWVFLDSEHPSESIKFFTVNFFASSSKDFGYQPTRRRRQMFKIGIRKNWIFPRKQFSFSCPWISTTFPKPYLLLHCIFLPHIKLLCHKRICDKVFPLSDNEIKQIWIEGWCSHVRTIRLRIALA